MNEYEKRVLASAYNIKNYCENLTTCDYCMFAYGKNKECLLARTSRYDSPYRWRLYEVNRK